MKKTTKNFDGIAGGLQPVLKSFTDLAIESAPLIKRLDHLLAEINLAVAKANQKEGIFDRLSQSAQELAITVPELHKISDNIVRNSNNLDKLLLQLEANPQSLLFGRSPSLPGPGEAGFVTPAEDMK